MKAFLMSGRAEGRIVNPSLMKAYGIDDKSCYRLAVLDDKAKCSQLARKIIEMSKIALT